MKCPFCNSELKQDVFNKNFSLCFNPRCRFHSTALHNEVWQALIDGKKAQEALEFVKMHIESLQTAAELCLENNRGDVRVYERDIAIAKLLQTAITSHQPSQPKEE